MTHTWDPDRYLAYASERGRPFVELIARIDPVNSDSPSTVVDLGCGPGNLTTLLAERWPGARITGLDSSPEMIEKAKGIDDRIGFEAEFKRRLKEAYPSRPHGVVLPFRRIFVVAQVAQIPQIPKVAS